MKPPAGAVVLFDGTNVDQWNRGRMTVDGLLMEGTDSKPKFHNCTIHIEFMTPFKPHARGQGRGNSGVFLHSSDVNSGYEIQVLDCYDNPTYADGTTGAIYGQFPPLVNACRKPGEWQAYDIVFEAPVWDEGWLVVPASVTVIQNGVLLHHRQEAMGPTGHRNICTYSTPDPDVGGLRLQDHGDAVRFRNIWVRSLAGYDAG